MTTLQKLDAVNSLVNEIPYRSDMEMYGLVDRWVGPAEMFDRQAGDCEDYAIGKAMLLLMMGVDQSSMYFTLEHPWGSLSPVMHMKLTVFLPGNDRPYVLDNRSPFLNDWFGAPYVAPVYLLGSTGMYAGLPRGKRGPLIAGRKAEPRLVMTPYFYEEMRQRLQPMLADYPLPGYPGAAQIAQTPKTDDHLAVNR